MKMDKICQLLIFTILAAIASSCLDLIDNQDDVKPCPTGLVQYTLTEFETRLLINRNQRMKEPESYENPQKDELVLYISTVAEREDLIKTRVECPYDTLIDDPIVNIIINAVDNSDQKTDITSYAYFAVDDDAFDVYDIPIYTLSKMIEKETWFVNNSSTHGDYGGHIYVQFGNTNVIPNRVSFETILQFRHAADITHTTEVIEFTE